MVILPFSIASKAWTSGGNQRPRCTIFLAKLRLALTEVSNLVLWCCPFSGPREANFNKYWIVLKSLSFPSVFANSTQSPLEYLSRFPPDEALLQERDIHAGEVQPNVASNSCVTITKPNEVNERTQVTEVPVIASLEVPAQPIPSVLEVDNPAKKRKIDLPSVEIKGVVPKP
jgi:hypothetical protein